MGGRALSRSGLRATPSPMHRLEATEEEEGEEQKKGGGTLQHNGDASPSASAAAPAPLPAAAAAAAATAPTALTPAAAAVARVMAVLEGDKKRADKLHKHLAMAPPSSTPASTPVADVDACGVLGLPPPTRSVGGHVVWSTTPDQVQQAYKEVRKGREAGDINGATHQCAWRVEMHELSHRCRRTAPLDSHPLPCSSPARDAHLSTMIMRGLFTCVVGRAASPR